MFSWSNNPGSSSSNTATRTQAAAAATYPAVRGTIRPPEYSRQQHLDSFVEDDILKKSTRKVSADDSTYDTVFQTVSHATLILRVNKPPLVHPNAPVRRPQMTLAGVKARHNWLDERMQVVGFPPIQSDEAWRTSRLLLGAAVHQVIQELQIHPPEILEFTDKSLRSIQPKQQNGTVTHHERRSSLPNPTQQQTTQTLPTMAHRKSTSNTFAPPDYDSSFASPPVDTIQLPRQFNEIETLSLSRTQELLSDELEFMAFCHSLPALHKTKGKGKERFDANIATAMKHLTQKETLEALSLQVTALRDALKERVVQFQKLQQLQDSLLAPPDEGIALRQLAVDKKHALQESEQLAEGWLEQGAQQPLAFVKDFVERRKQHHLAAAKMELLQMQRNK